MMVYLMNPSYTATNRATVQAFHTIVKRELDKYIVDNRVITDITMQRITQEMCGSDVLVVYNETAGCATNPNVRDIVNVAIECSTTIYPVATNKQCRVPLEGISEKQSYDIEEELRKRNLGFEYVESIAIIFSRKIISMVLPSVYSETGTIFLSHRRVDGEEIAANLCDTITQGYQNSTFFRDVTSVEVGEEAQKEIDKAMGHSDAFVFLHTPLAHKSDWIRKELMFAIIRHIPVLWVRIDNALIDDFPFWPSENPHLEFKSSDFDSAESLVKISETIVNTTFELIMITNNDLYGDIAKLKKMEHVNIEDIDCSKMLYSFTLDRRGYKYPQRAINHLVQFLGRTPTDHDISELSANVHTNMDSAIIVTNKIARMAAAGSVTIEATQQFFDEWNRYINGNIACNGKEIIISGAFPDSDEIYKQTLTDALLIFAREVLKSGYILTFGSHPTFQELFFALSREVLPSDSRDHLKMYISKFFEDKYKSQRMKFDENAMLCETDMNQDLSGSLTLMRQAMIARDDVVGVICLGGKCRRNKSDEGVREEIDIAKQKGVPVFIVGTVGGCSSVVASEYEKDSWSGLNSAPIELNKRLKDSIDYNSLAVDVLKTISE